MTRGLLLFLTVCLLTAGTYALPSADLKWACLIGLVVLWFVTPVKAAPARREDS